MVSNTSLDLLSWIITQNDGSTSGWFFLDAEKVPAKHKNCIWDILDELEDNSLAKQVRKYGAPELQQCDFSLTPLALDAVKAWQPKSADTIFSNFRQAADRWLESNAPSIGLKLKSVYSNLDSDNPEDWANAVHSCRRILNDLADALYPPRDEPVIVVGKPVKVGKDQYINRLVQFIASKEGSKTFADVVGADLSSIGKRLDAIYEATNKGTHADITKDEAARYIIHTYLLISGIASLANQ